MCRWPLLLVLAFAFFNGGCTVAVWEDATRTHNRGHVSDNVAIRDGAQRPVVSYGYNGRTALPADCDGRINGPVIYTGDARTATAITAELTNQQRTTLRDFRYSPDDRVLDTEELKWFPHDPSRNGMVYLQLPDADCLAIAVDPDGRALPIRRAGTDCAEDRLAEDARIILVPARQPRDPGERTSEIASAIIATPFCVAGDIVFSPLYLVVYLAHPDWF